MFFPPCAFFPPLLEGLFFLDHLLGRFHGPCALFHNPCSSSFLAFQRLRPPLFLSPERCDNPLIGFSFGICDPKPCPVGHFPWGGYHPDRFQGTKTWGFLIFFESGILLDFFFGAAVFWFEFFFFLGSRRHFVCPFCRFLIQD